MEFPQRNVKEYLLRDLSLDKGSYFVFLLKLRVHKIVKHVKNLAAFVASFLTYVWSFSRH